MDNNTTVQFTTVYFGDEDRLRVTLHPAIRKDKKLMAVFRDKEGSIVKKVHFGQEGAPDYTTGASPTQRANYRARHARDLERPGPMRPGYLAYHVLWGHSRNREANLKNYKQMYGFL